MKREFFWSAGFGIAALIALGLLFMAGVDVRSLLHTRLPEGLNDMVLFFLVGGILAPVAEEVFFRGILYGFFRRWGVIIAIVLSTGIFLLAHHIKDGFPATQLVGGILFAVAHECFWGVKSLFLRIFPPCSPQAVRTVFHYYILQLRRNICAILWSPKSL